MNLDDVPVENLFEKSAEFYGTEDPIKIVFARQTWLTQRYLKIESQMMGRDLLPIPVHLNDRIHQSALKERAWWITEEFAESLDALDSENEPKALEEMSDVLHFFTELLILSGVEPKAVNAPISPEDNRKYGNLSPLHEPTILLIIKDLGMAMWQLRNKPWKTSPVFTDVPNYFRKLIQAYRELLKMLEVEWSLSRREICLLYLRKSVVNEFRIRTKY